MLKLLRYVLEIIVYFGELGSVVTNFIDSRPFPTRTVEDEGESVVDVEPESVATSEPTSKKAK